MARLDRLGSAKDLAQRAAVIGRRFDFLILLGIADMADAEVRTGIERLIGAGLVFAEGKAPHTQYEFKHALVQVAAYESLLRRARQELHRRVVVTLEKVFPEVVANEPELLALHSQLGGMPHKAIDYWLAAGTSALARSANVEAAAHLRAGRVLLNQIDDLDERRRRELKLITVLGPALIANMGFAAAEVGEVFERGRMLCKAEAGNPDTFPVLVGSWVYSLWHTPREMVPLGRDPCEDGTALGARLAELAPKVDDRAHAEELTVKLRELIKLAQTCRERFDTLRQDLRHLLMLIEMGGTILHGLAVENIRSYQDLERLEGIDFTSWLAKYSWQPWISDLTQNPLLRGMYDFAFAYKNGDVRRPNFAAAPALRTIFRLCLSFKGSIFYKMNAGMGDSIFAPAYEALCNRGVDVKFFHKVKSLELSGDRTRVERIHLGLQATVKNGKYQPFVPVIIDNGHIPLPCWPDRPCYDQLLEGEELLQCNVDLESFWSTWRDVAEVTLEADHQFDIVVLGISLGSAPYVCRELVASSADWANMVANVATVRTQSLQLWLKSDIAELGWSKPSPMLDGWVESLNTWADLTDIMSFESWANNKPGSLAYFCGPMVGGIPDQSDTGFPAQAKAEVETAADLMLRRDIQTLWPSVGSGGLPSSDVIAKYVRANVDPSERYVLSLADSAKYRLPADGSGFSNLVITGDWIQNGYNAGCVEAAVWSGIQAANAILGRPLNDGVVTG